MGRNRRKRYLRKRSLSAVFCNLLHLPAVCLALLLLSLQSLSDNVTLLQSVLSVYLHIILASIENVLFCVQSILILTWSRYVLECANITFSLHFFCTLKALPIFLTFNRGSILICLWLRFLEIMTATVLMVNDFYRTVQWLCVASLEEDTCICDQMWPTVTRFPIPRWLWWSDWRSATPSTSWTMATSSSSPSSSPTRHPPRRLTGPPPLPALTGNCLTGIPDYHLHSMSHYTEALG